MCPDRISSRRGRLRRALLPILLLFAGNGPLLAAGYAFGVNGLDFSLSRYRLLDNGELRHMGHLPLDKATPAVAIHPSGKYLLVPSKTASSIAVLRLDRRTGRVSPVAGSPFPARATSPFALAIHPDGRYVYAAARFSGVAGYAFDEASGRLTPLPGSPWPAQRRTRSLVMHPSGRFLYAVNGYSNSLSAYAVDPRSGTLAPLPDSPLSVGDMADIDYAALGMADVPEGAGGIPYDVTIDPEGRFLFVANWAAASVSVFRIDPRSGRPALVPGSPFFTGFNPYRLRVHPSGRFLYVVLFSGSEIAVMAIDHDSGRLTPVPGSPFASGAEGPVAIGFGDAGRRLYVSHYEANRIVLMDLDPASGALQPRTAIATRFAPWDLALLEGLMPRRPATRLLGLADDGLELLAPGEDGLRVLARLPLDAGVLAVAPDGRRAWAGGAGGLRTVTLTADGLQTAATAAGTGPSVPTAIAVDVNGRYLYGLGTDSGGLRAWAIDPEDGSLRAVRRAAAPTGRQPVAIVLDPAARYAYVVNAGDDSVSVFRGRNATIPLLVDAASYGSPFATGRRPVAMAIEPAGRFAYVANAGSADLSAYRIHPKSGALSALPGSPFATVEEPRTLAMHPSGRWLYVAGGARLAIHAIEDGLGALANAVREVKLPLRPRSLSLDGEGRTLWVLGEGGRRLLRYAVGPDGGLRLTRMERPPRPLSGLWAVDVSRR